MRRYNVLLCGVGGTGVIGFGTLLKKAAEYAGVEVVGNEKRGRAQRGGSVINTVRYTICEENEPYNERKRITGAIPNGSADLMIATEPAEALRNTQYLSRRSDIVVNTYEMRPVGVSYPDINQALDWLRGIAGRVFDVNASKVSMEHFGTYRMTNYILLGVILAHTDMPIQCDIFLKLMRSEDEKKALQIGLDPAYSAPPQVQ